MSLPRSASRSTDEDPLGGGSPDSPRMTLSEAKRRLVQAFERVVIEGAMATCNGNVSAAARHLGIHRQSLQKKLGKLRRVSGL